MNRSVAGTLGCVLWLGLAAAPAPVPADAALTVRFSPHGGAEALLVESLAAARSQVLVQAYSFTSMPIAQALKAGHDRGLDVRVILDRSQETQRHSELAFLLEAGVLAHDLTSKHSTARRRARRGLDGPPPGWK